MPRRTISPARSIRRLAFLPLLTLVALAGAATRATSLEWTEDDWSGGRYADARGIDPEVAPGLLVLENRLDDLRLVARPTAFQGMYAMAVLHDTLFITASDYPYMFDGADVIAYDMISGGFDVVYQPYESGLHLIKRIGDTLYVPGPDSMDEWWQEGSIYTYDGGAWVEKATLPTAVHVNDVEIAGGRLYATTGHATGELNGFGCVWVSDDGGDSFQRLLTIEPCDAHFWRRFFGLGSHRGRLFVQPDGYPPENEVLYSTMNGTEWDTIPVPGMPVDKHAMFTSWGDSLLMTINDRMFIWDGSVWHPHTLPFVGWRWCRGIHEYKGRLYGGGDSCRLFRWLGGSNWETIGDLPVNPDSEEIEAMATCYGRLYICTSRPQQGMAPGLFVSAALSRGTLRSLTHTFAGPTTGARLFWDAFEPDPAHRARFQVRWSGSVEDIDAHPFVGPDGTASTWFEISGSPLPPAHQGARCYQFQAELQSPGGLHMPFVRQVRLTCDLLDPAGVAPDLPAGEDGPLPGTPEERSPATVRQPIRIRAESPAFGSSRIDLAADGSGFTVPPAGWLEVWIFDLRGALVRSIRLPAGPEGEARWQWDLRDRSGRAVPSGLYRVAAAWAGQRPAGQARSIVVLR